MGSAKRKSTPTEASTEANKRSKVESVSLGASFVLSQPRLTPFFHSFLPL